jgi:uncharacterized membrane protein YgdD (TMEM256/DUF423 family)
MTVLRIAAILGFLGVALGAFGAHALKDRLSPSALQIWNTAVLYHLLHAVALLALGLYARVSGTDVRVASALFAVGVVIFSGSLYALALSGIKPLGAITPLGGLCFLAGWAWLAFKTP